MSRLQTFTVETFHRLNPDWEINVYMPKQEYIGVDKYMRDYIGKDYFYLISNAEYINIKHINIDDYNIDHNLHNILRSDIFRYHILYEHGGVWSDFDVIWLKPMSHFYKIDYIGKTPMANISSIVSFSKGTSGHHSIGVMVHEKEDDFILSLVEEAKRIHPPYQHQSFGSTMLNSIYPTFESLKKFTNLIGSLYETYYPYSIYNLNDLYQRVNLSCITHNTICIHWFNGHVLSKQYVNNNNIDKKKCSMDIIIEKEISCQR